MTGTGPRRGASVDTAGATDAPDPAVAGRRAGVTVPLFSLTSRQSWGIGEFTDLPAFARWLISAGQSLVQILPITEIPDPETSPYSALTTMALDPIHISLTDLEDFQALGGEARFNDADRATLDEARSSARINHRLVRRMKSRWLRRSFERFTTHVPPDSARAQRYRAFQRDEAWWLDDYALFQAIRGRHRAHAWWDWPAPLARRDAAAIADASRELQDEIQYRQYLQWIAAEQWAHARAQARPVQVFGDVPFTISADSPDVWTRPDEFRLDATIGAPPDAFSDSGQDWGMPPWRWDVMASNDFEWMQRRARRNAALFDGFRLDHLVGLYRAYVRPLDRAVQPYFAPADEPTQLRLGERLVAIYLSSGAAVVVEDLGTVPEFVRESLRHLGVPGYKVLRWERRWDMPAQPFIDPHDYPEPSVATTGTHDTETLASWWDGLPDTDREQLLMMASLRPYVAESLPPLDALLRTLLAAGSRLTIIPLQDLFGWRDRINTPGQVAADNWTWRMPWRVDELEAMAEARTRASLLLQWTRLAGR